VDIDSGLQARGFFSQALHRWPLLVGLGLIGSIVGLAISLARPPRYQAETVLGVTINYGITEPLELVVEDRVLSRVAAVIEANYTLERVLEALPEGVRMSRTWLEPADLRKSLRLNRRLARWGLAAIDQDPLVAQEVAQQWATISLQVLDEAVEHAWRAAALLGGPFDVECGLTEAEAPIWQCQVTPLELDPEVLDGKLREELALSHGVLPIISYELLKAPELPEKPVVWERGALILMGTIAGLLIGFGTVLSTQVFFNH